jgi:hypothetical protein
LAGQKKYAEAEPLRLEGYRGMLASKRPISVPDRYHLDRARGWTAKIYQAVGQAAEFPAGVTAMPRVEKPGQPAPAAQRRRTDPKSVCFL